MFETILNVVSTAINAFTKIEPAAVQEEKDKSDKIINMKYFSQRNDSIHPGKNCFTNCAAMLVAHEKKINDKEFDEQMLVDCERNDDAYKQITTKLAGSWAANYRPVEVFAFWEWYMQKEYNIKTMFFQDAATANKLLSKNHPVIAGTNLTGAGHIVILCGVSKESPGFWVLDPWGKHPYKTQEDIEWSKPAWYGGYDWLKNYYLGVVL